MSRRPVLLALGALLFVGGTLAGQVAVQPEAARATARFADQIAAYLEADQTNPPPRDAILFIGSSIFRQWTGLREHMVPLPVFNRAFGGSRTGEVLHYMDRVVLPYRPRVVVYYCGSNDVNAGEPAEAIAGRYREFSERVRAALPDTRVVFVSIMKAPQKRDRWDVVDAANLAVRRYSEAVEGRAFVDVNAAFFAADLTPRLDLYRPDRLHLEPLGYDALSAAIRPAVERAWAEASAAAAGRRSP